MSALRILNTQAQNTIRTWSHTAGDVPLLDPEEGERPSRMLPGPPDGDIESPPTPFAAAGSSRSSSGEAGVVVEALPPRKGSDPSPSESSRSSAKHHETVDRR